MFHLILTACIAGSSADCAPMLLPMAESVRKSECEAQAARISESWLKKHPDLTGNGSECVETADLAALPLRKVAAGVYVFLGEPVQMEDSADGRIANLGVVIGEASVAVIDTGTSRRQGQELYAAIRLLTDLPVSHVILTHMHPDHALGTAVFKEAGAEVVGHASLPDALEFRAATYLDNISRLFPVQEVIGTEVILPDRTVEDQGNIDLGNRDLVLTAERAAHTDNDLTVFDKKTETFFSGDLIFRELTPVVDGSLNGWLDWMEAPPVSPAPKRIVPGHGDVAETWETAADPQSEFLNALRDATRATIADGMAMSDAVPAIAESLGELQKVWSSFPATVARDATAAYKELEWE